MRVAVKVLNTAHSDEIKQELFKRETTALRKLRHANIVGLRERGWWADENSFYIVLDYCPYSLLHVLQGESGTVKPDPYRVMRQMAEALAHAHSEGVIHRDIKPSNIPVDATGNARLTDFGISKLVASLTVGQTLAGYWSIGYAAPEQRTGGPASFASDVYSLGAVFFHMLSGAEPPPEGPVQSLIDERTDPPFRRMLRRMLALDPDARPTAGSELMQLLDAGRRNEPLPTYPLLLTWTALTDLSMEGHIGREDIEEARRFLLDELGGEQAEEVLILGRTWNDEPEIVILGDSIRVICAVSSSGDAFVCKTVQTPYDPILQQDKQRAMSCRALWVIGDGRDGGVRLGRRDDVQALLAELRTFQAIEASAATGRSSRREYIAGCQNVLRASRSRIERQGRTLKYERVHMDREYVRFELAEMAPDDLDWEDDTPICR